MNAVEIEEAVSALVGEPFNRGEFPYQFLAAFGFKDTTLKKLKAGASNSSDVPGAILLRNNIHLAVADRNKRSELLAALKASRKMAKGKCKFVLVTDGEIIEAEELATGDLLACPYAELANNFGFLLPLAGISTVAEIKDNPIDIRATGRLNKLYVELLKDNEDWASDAKRPVLNQFMARLIFCFFAEDTGIFVSEGLFTACLRQMTDPQSTNTHEVIKELFRAMNTPPDKRKQAGIKSWADVFRYVNGGLFSSEIDCPRFSKIARSYLLRVGDLNWKEINPDIFGSMIQSVADDDERGSLGLHYTSVPNILKVLDPLFLDDLRGQLEEAADSPRKLLNLRKRIASIRVFDPACGSGNFLVTAYREMRAIEAEIIRRRKDDDRKTWIKLTNFYGIEIKSFPAEIARLALLVAEFQCNVRHIGQREACLDVLPLHDTGKIVAGNALRLNWLEVCPPSYGGTLEEDLAGPTGRLALDHVKDAETYICGNPPFKGARKQTDDQKDDLKQLFDATHDYKDCDYVSGWYIKAASYLTKENTRAAFVSTSSICEGEQVAHIWSRLFDRNIHILFGHRPFGWSNSASNNAVVHCIIAGLCHGLPQNCRLYDGTTMREVKSISPYLVPGPEQFVTARTTPLSPGTKEMVAGSMPRDGGFLILSDSDRTSLLSAHREALPMVRRLSGTNELINGEARWCLWISDADLELAKSIPPIHKRVEAVRAFREQSKARTTNGYANIPHKFAQRSHKERVSVVVSKTSSALRPFIPAILAEPSTIITDSAFAIFDGGLLELSVVASRLHLAWIATVCGRLKTDYRYSKTLGWNTFPMPALTESDKTNLAGCAEDILLAREAHFPATIADLYESERMPSDLRAAHDRNDETLERIYIGRRFRNDTERLEKLFDMYAKMIRDEESKRCNSLPEYDHMPKRDADAQERDQA